MAGNYGNSCEWSRQNFSSQYQYNIKQTSDKNKEKDQLGDNLSIEYHILQTDITKNCMADSEENC